MKIQESERFAPTVDLCEHGDHLRGMVKEVKYVNTKYGELPVIVFIDVKLKAIREKQPEVPYENDFEEVQMWASRKNLRKLTEPDFLGAWVDIVCKGKMPGFLGYEYDIKKTKQAEL